MSELFERPLPNSSEAEKAVLGLILIDNRLMDQALMILKPEDFYIPSHRRIYAAMMALHESRVEIDAVLINEELKKENASEMVGGISVITSLAYGLPRANSIAHYARVIREKTIRRWIIREMNATTERAFDEDTDVEMILNDTIQRVSEVKEKETIKREQGGEGLELQEIYDNHLLLLKAGVNPSIPTGLEELDWMTGGGIAPGEVWGIGALSSQGKTSLLIQWLCSIAKRGIPCVLFSLEMSAERIALRIGTSSSGVSMKSLNPHTPHSHIDYLLSRSGDAFKSVPAVYTDCRSIGQFLARIRSIKRRHGIKVIGIDYYGLISGYGAGRDRYENRTQELKYISTALQQQIAIDEGVGLIVPAQFNRSAWSVKDPGPGNIDGGEAFYQACDLFATLETKPAKDGAKETKASLSIQKHRNGPTGKIDLLFNRECMEFRPRPENEGDVDEPEREKEYRYD